MKINIFSDLFLEPFLNLKNINFSYNENLIFPKIKDEIIVFIFSDYFRQYKFDNQQKLDKLIKSFKKKNKVLIISDIDSLEPNLVLYSSQDIYDLSIGYHAQMPFNSNGLKFIKNFLNNFKRHLKKGSLKVVFVDLDNTLIPGVWEEDKKNIKKTYFNKKNGDYHLLIKVLKKWHSYGCQIIIVSKNDKESILECLDFIDSDWSNWITHIDSGWSNKNKRITSLIKLMNISNDSCLFIDDNPIEIDSVKKSVKNINCIMFDSSFSNFFKKLDDLSLLIFSKPSQILERFKQYRSVLKTGIDIKESFLNVEYDFNYFKNHKDHFERIIDLSSKTNQFNLNKKPLVKINIKKYDFISWDCKTSFGYLGVVGYAIIDSKNKKIVNFVMSCRALGFNLENEILKLILDSYEINFIEFKKTDRNNVGEIFLNNLEKKYEIKRTD